MLKLRNQFKPLGVTAVGKKMRDFSHDKVVLSSATMSEYIPVWDMFPSNGLKVIGEEFTLEHKERHSLNLDSTDRTTNTLSTEKVERDKLNVTHNSLVLGPMMAVINLTDRTLLITSKEGLLYSYAPMTNTRLKESSLNGHVIIYRQDILPSPCATSTRGLGPSYVGDHLSRLKSETLDKSAYGMDLYEHVNKVLIDTEDYNRISGAGSMSVSGVLDISKDDVKGVIENGTMYLPCISSTISFSTPEQIALSPDFLYDEDNLEFMNKLINNPSVHVFLNDFRNEVKCRWMNTAGVPSKIDRVDLVDREPGVYKTFIVNGNTNTERLMSIEEYLSNPHFFDTREEAELGMSKIKQRELELKEKELEAVRIKAESAASVATRSNEASIIKTTSTGNEAILEENKHLRSLIEQGLKADRDKYASEREVVKMRTKDYYDERSYKRNSTLETLKTIAGIAGVVSTGILIYSKLSN